MSDYKTVRLGPKETKIPIDWNIGIMHDIVKYKKGNNPNNLYDKKRNENYLPYLKAEYMRGESPPVWCNKEEKKVVIANEQEPIIIWDGSYSGDVFRGFSGAVASTMAKIIPNKEKIDGLYLYYFLSKMFKIFNETTIGTSVPHLSTSLFRNLTVPLPSISEQHNIASILSTVDQAIERTQAVIDQTARFKKGLMQELLTKGIGHTEFKEVQIGPKKVEVPEEWEIKKVGKLRTDCDNIVQTGPFGSLLHASDYVSEGVPFILIRNMKENRIDTTDMPYITKEDSDRLSKYRLKHKDLIFSRVGRIGSCIYTTKEMEGWVISGQLLRIRVKDSSIHNKFLNYMLLSRELHRQLLSKTVGSTRKSLNTQILESLIVLIPPMKEQEKITKILKLIEEKKVLELTYKSRLQRLKNALMQDLLTGKVRVKELSKEVNK